METLKDAFCRKFSCAPEEFERRALIVALYPHARIFSSFGAIGTTDLSSTARWWISVRIDAQTRQGLKRISKDNDTSIGSIVRAAALEALPARRKK